MAVKLYNLARCQTTTTGTGTLTVGSAVAGYLGFAAAGVQDGDTVRYAIRDGSNSEIGYGVWTAANGHLTRNVLKSTASDSAISLSGNAQVFITPSAEDLSGSVGTWNYWKIRARSADPTSAPVVANLQLCNSVGGSAATVSDSFASSGTSADAFTSTGWQPSNRATVTGNFGTFTLGDAEQYVVAHFTTAQAIAQITLTSVANARTSLASFDVLVSNDNAIWYVLASYDCNIASSSAQAFNLPISNLGGVAAGSGSGGGGGSPSGETTWNPPTTSTFTTFRSGSSSSGAIANLSGSRGVRITATKATSNTNSSTYAVIAVPTGGAHSGWTATARLRRHYPIVSWGMSGMIIRDSASGKSRYMWLGNDVSIGFNFNNYSNDDTWAAVSGGGAWQDFDWWQRVWHDGTNINWQVSKDGDNWETIVQESPTTYLTNAPTHVGIAINPNFGGQSTPSRISPFALDCLSWAAAAY